MTPSLEEPQVRLLSDLVEASRRVPTDQRRDFIAFRVISGDPRLPLRHPGFRGEDVYLAHPQDIEILRQVGFITFTSSNKDLLQFFVHPQAFRYYEESKRQAGGPVERVETEVRRWIESDSFRREYGEAYAKWAKAEDLLWAADSGEQLSAIGHHCREAMQGYATALVNRYNPPGVTTDLAKSVARLRAVLEAARLDSEKEQAVLDALIVYWGAVSALVQRQEHAGQKEGRPVTWEDARRSVFQVMMVMFEIARSLEGPRQPG